MIFVGLGGAGCKIIKQFDDNQNDGVDHITIDVGSNKKDTKSFSHMNHIQLPKVKTMEEMEKESPDFTDWINEDKETTLVLAGSGLASGCLMKLIESIVHKDGLEIIYIRPDMEFLNKEEILRERLVFKVLQELARSGSFKRLYLLDNKKIVDILPDINIENYYDKINETIAFTFNMIKYACESDDSIRSNLTEQKETCRIVSFGPVDFEKSQENLFFDLKTVREKQILYLLSQKTLKDKSLLNKISRQMKDFSDDGNISVSYKVIKNDEQDQVFCLSSTSIIQD